MKKTLYSFILFFCFSTILAQDVVGLETFEKAMKPGAILTYDVNMGGKKYQLIATLKKLGDEFSFDWKATEPINKTGSVSMNALALSKADALLNYFNGGEMKLEKETSLFISKKIFTDVATTSQAALKINGQSDTATIVNNTIAEIGVTVNGEFISVPAWELQGGSDVKYTIDVVESQKFALITKVDLGWTMQLLEVKNP